MKTLIRLSILLASVCTSFATVTHITRPTSVVSRKTHSGVGNFDISLPLNGTTAVECRSGGSTHDYKLVFTYPTSVTISSAYVRSGTGVVGAGGVANSSLVSVSGSVVTVPLTNVADAQTLAVTVADVNDGTNTGDTTISLRFLLGDTNADGGVNSADATQIRNRSGQAIDSSNFVYDVNADGAINSADLTIARDAAGGYVQTTVLLNFDPWVFYCAWVAPAYGNPSASGRPLMPYMVNSVGWSFTWAPAEWPYTPGQSYPTAIGYAFLNFFPNFTPTSVMMKFRLDPTSGAVYQSLDRPDLEPLGKVRPMIAVATDYNDDLGNYSGTQPCDDFGPSNGYQVPYQFRRWWAQDPNSYTLGLNDGTDVTITVDITDPTKWSSVCGRRGDDPAAATYFQQAIQQIHRVGLTFGGIYYGHGVWMPQGSSTFTLLDYQVNP
ncbi:MAG: dockerin type I domain-containing protein [Acidobacteriota bacterium]|nr:dockerin type I domain-containing protein [Acidobacteriota bacterium]